MLKRRQQITENLKEIFSCIRRIVYVWQLMVCSANATIGGKREHQMHIKLYGQLLLFCPGARTFKVVCIDFLKSFYTSQQEEEARPVLTTDACLSCAHSKACLINYPRARHKPISYFINIFFYFVTFFYYKNSAASNNTQFLIF